MKGIYVLVLQMDKDACINIGALGEIFFQKGTYLYVGSSQNNLMQRVKGQLKKEKRKFWHIDYLLENKAASIVGVFYKQMAKSGECNIARKVGNYGVPMISFGCSDCYCKSHLFQVDSTEFLKTLMQPLDLDFK